MTRSGVWLGLLLLPVMAWSGEAYRCTDDAGKITFSDQPCGQAQESRIYTPALVPEKRETLSDNSDPAPPLDDTTSGTVFERLQAMPKPVVKDVTPPQPTRSPYAGLPPDIRRSMEMGDEARSNMNKVMEFVQREQARQAVEHKKSKVRHYAWVLILVLGVIAVVALLLSKHWKGIENRPNQLPQATKSAKTGDIQLYTPRQAGFGTFLGGPLAGIYMLYRNFEAMNEPDLAESTLVIGGVCCLAMIGVLPFLPDHFPGSALPVAYTLSIVHMMKHYQLNKEDIENSLGYVCQSSWRAALISLVGLLVLLAVAVAWLLTVS